MAKSDKSNAYREVIALLKTRPIMSWACSRAGISRQAVYERMRSDEDYRAELKQAKAIGQEPYLEQASPERILAWSDPEVFTNRQTVAYEQTTPIVIQVSDKLRDRLAG